MLTIKQITSSGEEYIHEAEDVTFTPASAKRIAPAENSVWYKARDGRLREIISGSVFVMNEHGKTVAKYELGVSKVPLEEVNAAA